MSSERYELAQDDLEAVLEKVESSIDIVTNKRKRMNPEERRQLLTRCRSELNDSRGLVKEMEQEARVAPMQYRNAMLAKVRHFRDQMAKMHQDVKTLSERPLYDPEPEVQQLTVDEQLQQQARLGVTVLERTGQSLARSQQVAIETEEVGEAIIDDLGVQRESLVRSRARLQDTHAEISQGRRVLTRLKVATLYNKIILIMIIIIELAIIGCIVYWKWFKK